MLWWNGRKLSFIGDTDEYGRLVGLLIDGAQYFYVYNGNGEIIGLTDSSGAFAVRYSYDSWGTPTEYNSLGQVVPLGTFPNPYLYKTYYYDTETASASSGQAGLCYLNARYYNPSMGRFLTRDPLPGTDDNRLSKNPYIYTENDPVGSSDPDGQMRRPQKPKAPYKHAMSSSVYSSRAYYWRRVAENALTRGNIYYANKALGTSNFYMRKAATRRAYERKLSAYRRDLRKYNAWKAEQAAIRNVRKSYNNYHAAGQSLAKGNIKAAKSQLKKSQQQMEKAHKASQKAQLLRGAAKKKSSIRIPGFGDVNLKGEPKYLINSRGIKVWAKAEASAKLGKGKKFSIPKSIQLGQASISLKNPSVSYTAKIGSSSSTATLSSNSWNPLKGNVSYSHTTNYNISQNGINAKAEQGLSIDFDKGKIGTAVAVIGGIALVVYGAVKFWYTRDPSTIERGFQVIKEGI